MMERPARGNLRCEDLFTVFVYLGTAIVVAPVAWLFGSVVARIAGILLAGFGALGMVTSGARDQIGAAVAAFIVFILGFALWLAGHWMFAYKHQRADGEFPSSTTSGARVSAGANVTAVQRMLGHGSAALTLDTYADLLDTDLDEVAADLGTATQAAAAHLRYIDENTYQ